MRADFGSLEVCTLSFSKFLCYDVEVKGCMKNRRMRMKISTKGIYALETAVDLAIYSSDGNLVSIRSVSERRHLSEKYLERIVSMLKKAGIVKSTRGACGGYCLAREAGEITVLEVLMAVEGNLAPVECLTKETDCGMDCEKCVTKNTWNHIWNLLRDTVWDVTIGQIRDLVKSRQKTVGGAQ